MGRSDILIRGFLIELHSHWFTDNMYVNSHWRGSSVGNGSNSRRDKCCELRLKKICSERRTFVLTFIINFKKSQNKGGENLICWSTVCKTRRCNGKIQSEYPKFDAMTSKLTKSQQIWENLSLPLWSVRGLNWKISGIYSITTCLFHTIVFPWLSFVALVAIHLVGDTKNNVLRFYRSIHFLIEFYSLRTWMSFCTPIHRFASLREERLECIRMSG